MEVYVKHICISGNLVEQAQSLAEPLGLQHVGVPRSFPPHSLQALWTRPPRSDLSHHFGGSILILLILHDSSQSHLYVSTQQKQRERDFLTSSIHLSFGLVGNNLKCKGCSAIYYVTPLFESLLRLFDLQQTNICHWLHSLSSDCLSSLVPYQDAGNLLPGRPWYLTIYYIIKQLWSYSFMKILKDNYFIFLQFFAFSYHPLHSLGLAARHECSSQMWRRHYCPADPADLELMHYLLLNGLW